MIELYSSHHLPPAAVLYNCKTQYYTQIFLLFVVSIVRRNWSIDCEVLSFKSTSIA